VYLVQRAVPMLPPQLSEQLCSLQPGVDRLTFSAIFTVDKDGKVLKKSFARTVIRWVKPEGRADHRSCGKLSYADAQGVIGGHALAQAKVEGLASEVEKDIRALHVGCETCTADSSPSPPRSAPVVSSLAP
jgi:protein SSD1